MVKPTKRSQLFFTAERTMNLIISLNIELTTIAVNITLTAPTPVVAA